MKNKTKLGKSKISKYTISLLSVLVTSANLGFLSDCKPENNRTGAGGGVISSIFVKSFKQQEFDYTVVMPIKGRISIPFVKIFRDDDGKFMKYQTNTGVESLFSGEKPMFKVMRKKEDESYESYDLDAIKVNSIVANPDIKGRTGFTFTVQDSVEIDVYESVNIKFFEPNPPPNYLPGSVVDLNFGCGDLNEVARSDEVSSETPIKLSGERATTVGERFGCLLQSDCDKESLDGNFAYLPAGTRLNDYKLIEGKWIKIENIPNSFVGYDINTQVKLSGETDSSTLVDKFGSDVYVKLPAGTKLGDKTLDKATWIYVFKVPDDVVGYDADIPVIVAGAGSDMPLKNICPPGQYVKLPSGTKLGNKTLDKATWIYVGVASGNIVSYATYTSVQLPGEENNSMLGERFGSDVYVDLPPGTVIGDKTLGSDTWIYVGEVLGDFVGYDKGTRVQLPNEAVTTLGERFGSDVYVDLPPGTVIGDKTLGSDTWIYVGVASGNIVSYATYTSVQLPGEAATTLGERFGKYVYVKLPAGTVLNGLERKEATWIYVSNLSVT